MGYIELIRLLRIGTDFTTLILLVRIYAHYAQGWDFDYCR